ncbi:MAG TPA: 50S ribosomal protein L15 [Ktedonobacterales bacterium]|nr:50S ribosomal protein L15 [Ktedonobacterales bacterium]
MRLADLRPSPGARKARTRVGRGHGSGHVKTAGRGQKGQKARTGSSVPAYFEGGQNRFSQRMPYVDGFKNPFRKEYAVINLSQLVIFAAGSEVSAATLAAKGLVRGAEAKRMVKVLGMGEVDRALTVRAHKVSESARKKIEAAGGSVEIIALPPREKTKRAPKGTKPTYGTAGATAPAEAKAEAKAAE